MLYYCYLIAAGNKCSLNLFSRKEKKLKNLFWMLMFVVCVSVASNLSASSAEAGIQEEMAAMEQTGETATGLSEILGEVKKAEIYEKATDTEIGQIKTLTASIRSIDERLRASDVDIADALNNLGKLGETIAFLKKSVSDFEDVGETNQKIFRYEGWNTERVMEMASRLQTYFDLYTSADDIADKDKG
jgi:hypothetical protein